MVKTDSLEGKDRELKQHYDLPDYCLIEQLYAGTRTLVYRAIRHVDQHPVVIKLLKNTHPGFSELVQFRNQYTITKDLDIPGIIHPYDLEPYRNGYALIMEDFDGISLREWLQQGRKVSAGANGTGEAEDVRLFSPTLSNPSAPLAALSLEHFFPIAIQLVETLHLLHQQRIIHKDIKPSNILIHPQSHQVKLLDFSISTLLPREAQEIQSAGIPEGTLSYLSPEQTGRMNRGIDYRSDFYALGVTFYELLTGQLPFQSNDPMELVHCHLAKQPPVAHSLNPLVPSILSAMIAKLMAKNAEDRYQSALGLQRDLEACFAQYQQTNQIEPFGLGAHDRCDRLIIPEKLYGREQEIAALLAAFEQVARSGRAGEWEGRSMGNAPRSSSSPSRSELMLVAGFSGIGKTAVVNEVHKPIVRQRGYFIKGKFDQFQRNVPFSALVQAFRHLMAQLLSEPDDQLAQWKASILNALGENAQVIIEVVPELEHIIGQQPEVQALSGNAAQSRFNLLFQKFIQVFATADHPLVVFIDDLQWADSASFNLIKLLISEAETGYLLLLGAYRDNEVSAAHPLMLTLADLKQSGAPVNTLTLTPLSADHINQLIAETLSCTQALALPLTEWVYQKAQGNPFFTNQFLKVLHEDGLITFDHHLGSWQCDIAAVRSLALTDDVVEFMTQQLQKLPAETQTVLKLAACIGNQFDLQTLAIVSEQTAAQVALDLWRALQDGLLLPISDVYKFYQGADLSVPTPDSQASKCGYRFLHDRVQQGAYSLIAEQQKPAIHLKIGQLLLHNTRDREQDNNLFAIVNHLNIGAKLVVEPETREQMAQLNVLAAQKARAATAYESALTYATTGIALLSPNVWQPYELALTLHELATESAFLVREFEQMEHWAAIALQQARTPLDQVKIYEIKIQASISQHQPLAAIALGRQVMSQFGIQLPDQPTQEDIHQAFQQTASQFAGKAIEAVLNLPPMTAPEPLAAMKIAASTAPAMYFAAPPLYPLLILSQVNASLQYGNAPLSAFFYASYGLLLNGVLGDMEAADRAGKLALRVLETLNARDVECGTRFILGALVVHGTAHVQTSLQYLRESYQIGLETGDTEFAGHAAFNSCHYAYFSGQELAALEQDIHAYSQMLTNLKQVMQLHYCQLFRQVALNLLGTSKNPRRLVGDFYDETQALSQFLAANDQMGLHFFYLHKLILGYLFDDAAHTLSDLATQSRQYLAAGVGFITVPIFYFYDSLVALAEEANCEAKAASDDRLQRVAENQARLQKWAHHAPMNYLHKWHLVEAETHRVRGNKAEAIDQYDRAIAAAKANQYINEAAIANELAARFYLNWGKERLAQEYLIEAYYGYARWGAKAKVIALEATYPHLLTSILQQRQPSLTAAETILSLSSHTRKTTSSSSASETLDVAAVLKASQTLSSEMQLDRLVFALLELVIESAGAEKAALMLLQDDHLMLTAVSYAESCPNQLYNLPVEASTDIPVSLVNAVKRTLQPTVITNASQHPKWVTDPYIQQQHIQSVLCSPILHQGKPLGVLYLENNLVAGAFTSDRVQLLNLLCSQAAISLENARLYERSQAYAQQLETSLEDLQQHKARFQRLVANVPGMIYQFRLEPDGSNSTPYVSPGCYAIYELDPAAVMAGQQNLYAMHHPDDNAAVERAVAHSATTLLPFKQEFRIVTPSGKVKWVQSIARPARQDDNAIIWDGVVIDVSERKHIAAERRQAERALRLSEERYRHLINVTSQIVWIATPDGESVDSPQWCAYTGQSLDKLKNFGWLEAIHPEDMERTGQVWNHARENLIPYKTAYRIRGADGSYRLFDVQGVPIVAEDGSIREWIGACSDITDRHHAEAVVRQSEAQLRQKADELEQTLQALQRTQTQMVQSEKMSGLGQLVAGVAHEINNPVNFIYGNLNHAESYTQDLLGLVQLYQRHYPAPHPEVQQEAAAIDLEFLIDDLPKLLTSMKVGADRIQKIVASLRNFSRMDEAEMKEVNIHDGIDSTLMILQHRLKARADHPGIEITKIYGELPLVECYAGQLNQVFMNLLSNAIDALEESFPPEASTVPTITIQTEVVDAQQIAIHIADNGAGIPARVQQRLFDPFFTTKPVGKGTGMGLSISYQIVTEKHKGTLQCVSEPKQGATFIITIPIRQF